MDDLANWDHLDGQIWGNKTESQQILNRCSPTIITLPTWWMQGLAGAAKVLKERRQYGETCR